MSLPKKAEKGYLEVQHADDGIYIVAKKDDAGALAGLFLQYGMSCERRSEGPTGQDTLRFPKGMDRSQVERLLEEYKNATGS